CMDGPYAGYKDAAGLERACRMARAMGFDGKQCIHPSQLSTVNGIFAPSAEEIAKAEAIVEAYETALASGQGAVTHDGRMIDAATARMAQTIVGRRRLTGASGAGPSGACSWSPSKRRWRRPSRAVNSPTSAHASSRLSGPAAAISRGPTTRP